MWTGLPSLARSLCLTERPIRVITAAPTNMKAETRNAVVKPCVVATAVACAWSCLAWSGEACAACASPGASSVNLSLIALVETVPSSARPTAPPICWTVFSTAEPTPESVSATPADRGQRERHEDQAHAERQQQDERQQATGVVRVHRELVEAEQTAGRDGRTGAGDPARVDPGDQDRGELRRDHDAEAERQEGEAGLQRAVAQHVLDVDAEEVEHREHRRTDDQHHEEADPTGPVGQDPERHQRVPGPGLDAEEDGDQGETADDEGQRHALPQPS